MADFGGFNVQTPQEVLTQLNAKRQQIAQIPDQQARNEANIVFQLSNMFGNPELKKARQLEKNLAAAQAGVDETSTHKKGSLEYESDRLSAMYEAVKHQDPVAASQIASQITQIDEARFERNRLNRIDARAQTQSDNAAAESYNRQREQERENLQNNTTYIETVDDQGNATYAAFNLADPASRLEFEKARMKDNTVVLTRSEMAARGGDADDADIKLHNNSTFSTKIETLQASDHALRQAGRMVSILASNPDANTSFADLQEQTNELVQEGKAILNKAAELAGFASADDNANMAKIKSALTTADWYLQMDAEDQQAIAGLGLNMAYVLARSLDPSGRLSDADVAFAAQMIASSNGDPTILARVMTEQVVSNASKWAKAERVDLNSMTPRERRNSSQARRLEAALGSIDESIADYRTLLVDNLGIIDGGMFDRILTPFSVEPARAPVDSAIRNRSGEGVEAQTEDEDLSGVTIE
jgi:hypothetical protein